MSELFDKVLIRVIWFLLITSSLVSCSEPETYSKMTMWKMAQAEENTISIVIPGEYDEPFSCDNYGNGCLNGVRVSYKILEFIIIEFDSEKNARLTALAIDQYYARNWVFDNIADEPILEHFAKKVYDAKRPKVEVKKQSLD